MKHIYFLLSIFTFLFYDASAQKFWTDQQAFQNMSFEKLVKETDKHYEKSDDQWQPGYIPYKEWQIRQRQRMGLNNQIVNGEFLTYQALKKWQKEHSKNTQRNFHGDWREEGPFAQNAPYWNILDPGMGRINCIAFHPNEPNTLFVGAAGGGLWKSLDDGSTWQPLTDGLPSIGISGIQINSQNPDEMWILTGDGDGWSTQSIGILHSSDGGHNWTKRGFSFALTQTTRAFKLVQADDNSQHQYAATSTGVFKTLNGWQTWSLVLDEYTWDVAFHPSNSNIVYAATTDGFFKSSNDGSIWDLEDGNGLLPNDFSRFGIGVSPDRPDDVALLYGGGPSGFPGLFRSADAGDNWVIQYDNNSMSLFSHTIPFMDNVNQAWYNLSIAVHPDSAEVLYTGGFHVFKSENFGNQFELATYQTNSGAHPPEYPRVKAGIHALEFHPNGDLYVGSDGGLYKSENGGSTFINLSQGLRIAQTYFVDVANDRVINGAATGSYRLDLDQDNNGNILDENYGMACFFRDNTENNYFISSHRDRFIYDPHPAFSSDFVNITSSLNDGNNWDEDFISLPNTNGILHCRNEVYRSFNSGSSWEDMDAFDNNEDEDVSAAVASGDAPGNGFKLYVAKGNRLKRCDFWVAGIQNISWTNLTNEIPDSFYITDMALDDDNDGRLFISLGGFDPNNKVWRKNGLNGNWTNLTGNLPNVPVYSIAYHPNANDRIYVGTEIGVFYRDDNNAEWQYFGNQLPTVPVYDLQIENPDVGGSRLYAATFGRGIWSTSLSLVPCAQVRDLAFGDDPSANNGNGMEVHEAEAWIISDRKISGGFGTNVLYSAGEYVELQRGFEAKRNSIFTATLDGCQGVTIPE